MDFLEISELYHHNTKGAKWGNRKWTKNDQTTTLNDAGFLRTYGHPRGIRGDAIVPNDAKSRVNIEIESLLSDMESGFRSSSEESSSKSTASSTKTESKTTETKTANDPRLDKIKEWKTKETYDKYRKMYEPTQTEQLQKGLSDISKGLNDASNSPLLKGNDKKIYGKYPKMTDQELRDKINRLNAERTYSDLIGDTKVIKSGQERAREILQTLGGIAGLAVAGVTIYTAIKNK